jgi:hypothetical protein
MPTLWLAWRAIHRPTCVTLVFPAPRRWGSPDFFVTLSAGDKPSPVDGLQWFKVRQIVQFFSNLVGRRKSWQDLPVENAHVFHTRFSRYLKLWLCPG